MKKRLAVVLSAIMALTMFGGQFAFAASGDQFTDVPSDAWYKPDVDYVAENDYMIGTSDTTFEPQSNLTRAMFATILARYDGAEVDDSVPTIFTDVEVNQWFTGSIGWANEKKIVEGRGDNIFDPTSFITRQELAVMVERYITYVESTTDKVHVTPGVAIPFTDADQISDYAKDAMDKAVIHGLIIGYPDKSVKPLQNITRAETAAVIHRIKWKTRDGRENFTITVLDKDGNEIGKFDKPVGQLIDPFDLTDIEAPYGLRITLPDGTTTTVQKGDKIMLDGDITIEPIVDFEVTRIDSVNDKELGKDLVKPEESYTVPEGQAKSGYTFKEWNTEKDGTGTAYQPADTIALTDDLTLYAIYTKSSGGSGPSVTSEKYKVVAEFSLKERTQKVEREGKLEDATLLLETPVYTVSSNGNGDKSIAEVMKDLANNDEGAIDRLAKEFYDDLTAVHEKTVVVGSDTYVVTINADKKITAVKNGTTPVTDWAAQLTEEQNLYQTRMDDIADKAGITGNADWDAFVKAFAPTTLFTATDTSLDFNAQSVYTESFKTALEKSGAVMDALGEDFDEAWNAVNTFLTDPAGMAVEPGTFTVDAEKLASAFGNDKGILKKLGAGYQLVSAEETVDQDTLLTLINQRISRAWVKNPENVSAIVAFLKANVADQDSKFFGKYSMKISIEKVS